MVHLFNRTVGDKALTQDREQLEHLLLVLAARPSGAGWMARCPAHDERTPSLSIRYANDRILVHCFGGCDQKTVLDALERRGLWRRPDRLGRRPPRAVARPRLPQQHRVASPSYRDFGFQLWDQGALLFEDRRFEEGSWPPVLRRYFSSRHLRPYDPCQRLRFHPEAPAGRGALLLPALLALVTGVNDQPIAVQATFLKPDGSGKADIEPNRKTYDSTVGGAVRLLEGDDALILGEGVETTLSAMQATGEGGFALLGTSGLRNVRLPHVYKERQVLIAADNDASGSGQAAAREAGRRLKLDGFVDVRMRTPDQPGQDFNDLLRAAP
jgi:putative DNA primase/helicase